MKIYLRPVKISDGACIVKWRNSGNVKNHCFDKSEVTLESNEQFYKSYIETGKYKQFIVERVDEDFGTFSYPISTIYLKNIDRENHRCELCIFTSDDQEWNTESQTIAIKQMLEKAFNEYGMNKVYTYVFKENKDEVELLVNSGFHEEAILSEEAVDINGKYVDVIRMCVFGDRQKNEN